MALSIDDLLNALKDPNRGLTGSAREIWNRIARRDKFEELDGDSKEREEIIKEWIEANPYSNI